MFRRNIYNQNLKRLPFVWKKFTNFCIKNDIYYFASRVYRLGDYFEFEMVVHIIQTKLLKVYKNNNSSS